MNGAQLCESSGPQLPSPLHLASSVAVPPLQCAARHTLLAPGYAQRARCEPSQLPPQTVPSVSQATRPPRGGPLTGQHVPSLFGTSQASHWPSQAASQQ